MNSKSSWEEFRNAGLLWWVNRQLHLFGWSICVEVDPDEPEKIVDAYPIRTKFRGFSEDSESRGFKKLTGWIGDQIESMRSGLNVKSEPDD